MSSTISPERVALLEEFDLAHGSHGGRVDPANPELCSMEWVSFLAGEGITDAPACASPVLARYVIRLNDRWDGQQRQALKPYLVRMIGTGGDGKDAIRKRIATERVTKHLLPDWLRLAGMGDQIAALDAVEPGNWGQLRSTLYAVREAAWAKRSERREVIKQKVREELAKREKPAAAAAAAAADADAAAVAAAVADAAGGYWAAYQAARKVFDKAYAESDVYAQVRALGEQQAPQALELLDLLIDADTNKEAGN